MKRKKKEEEEKEEEEEEEEEKEEEEEEEEKENERRIRGWGDTIIYVYCVALTFYSYLLKFPVLQCKMLECSVSE